MGIPFPLQAIVLFMGQANMSHLDNGKVHVAIDLSHGGAIAEIRPSDSSENLLNAYDAGRYLQQSLYGDNEGGRWNGRPWPFNPVQGGDWRNEPSRVVWWSNDGIVIQVQTQPRDWGGRGETPCIMESWISLEGSLIKVRFFFRYEGNTPHAPRHQEVPALFVRSDLDRLVYYAGTSPWAGDGLSAKRPVALEQAGHGESIVFSESWVAFVDASQRGIGIYKAGARQATTYRAGPAGTAAATSYVALLDTFALTPGQRQDYTVYLRPGTLDEIRASFRELHLGGH